MITERSTLVIDAQSYPLLDLGRGRVQWNTEEVETQPGDGGVAKPHTLYWHAGFGVNDVLSILQKALSRWPGVSRDQ